MSFARYFSILISYFRDSRIKAKVKDTLEKMKTFKSLQLWQISEGKKEFERMKHLFDGSLQSVLNNEKISNALLANIPDKITDLDTVYCLHDPSSIRKKNSKKSENLGKVRDLDGKMINGFETFNTVAVDSHGKNLTLLDSFSYSNGEKRFVTKEEMAKYRKGKLLESSCREDLLRHKAIEEYIQNGNYINLEKIAFTQLERVSTELKKNNPLLKICHVLDRGFDGTNYFEFIDQKLKDDYVIRLKISRNSAITKTNEKNGKEKRIKLKDVRLCNCNQEIIEKIRFKNKIYEQVKRVIEWGNMTPGKENSPNVVRVTFYNRDGKMIFKEPMLLATNITLNNCEIAKAVYRTYLMRSKIEEVFKFLKTNLGWEEIQVRDWESIRNLLALCFFIGAYFYEIEHEITKNKTLQEICILGGGKGKMTKTYFMRGLCKLLIAESVNLFLIDRGISKKQYMDMLEIIR